MYKKEGGWWWVVGGRHKRLTCIAEVLVPIVINNTK